MNEERLINGVESVGTSWSHNAQMQSMQNMGRTIPETHLMYFRCEKKKFNPHIVCANSELDNPVNRSFNDVMVRLFFSFFFFWLGV